MNQNDETSAPAQPRWQLLDKLQRRVLGVLVEKAKTTPENYPLSLNALVAGCNQKSNRAPQMQLNAEQVEEVTEGLRALGAMAVIQGGSRVDKYRHLLYEWLGVDKVELAVMGELLLRGAQTLGTLRGRAARMEPIAGIAQLQPILARLQEKGLIVYLTPQGRGGIVTHALYQPQELDRLRKEVGTADLGAPAAHTPESRRRLSSEPIQAAPALPVTVPMEPVGADVPGVDREQFELLRGEVASLRQQLAEFRQQTESSVDQLRRDLEDLNRQLGN
jgi:hypothetical protein